MSDFKAKMHQIRFRLGLRLQTPLGELTALPRLPSWILGGLLLRGWRFSLVVTRWSQLDQRSYSTLGPVSTWMGDRLRAGELSRYVTSHPV